MTLIYASKYDEIVAKLEGMRSTVGASWGTVTTYGTGKKPSAMGIGTEITANQINLLIEAFNDFELKWIAGSDCAVTTVCHGTAGDCLATGGSFSGVYSSQIGNRCALTAGADNDTNRGSVMREHTLSA